MDKVSKVVERCPDITRAVVIGNANENNYILGCDNIPLAIFTKQNTKISKVCIDLNNMLYDSQLKLIDIYPMADEDFYLAVSDLLTTGETIFERL